jgi:hypothetical protein
MTWEVEMFAQRFIQSFVFDIPQMFSNPFFE